MVTADSYLGEGRQVVRELIDITGDQTGGGSLTRHTPPTTLAHEAREEGRSSGKYCQNFEWGPMDDGCATCIGEL